MSCFRSFQLQFKSHSLLCLPRSASFRIFNLLGSSSLGAIVSVMLRFASGRMSDERSQATLPRDYFLHRAFHLSCSYDVGFQDARIRGSLEKTRISRISIFEEAGLEEVGLWESPVSRMTAVEQADVGTCDQPIT